MAELARLRSDGRVEINFHPGQSKVWISTARFTFMIAGTQSGKTAMGPHWIYREIYDPEMGRGPGDYLAVTSSFDLFKIKMLPALREVFEHMRGMGRYWSGDRVIELRDPETGEFWAKRADDPMWGRIILRSASAESGLESATAKAAWLDEVGQDSFRIDAWEAIRRRLSLHRGRVLGTTTPYNLGWLKTEIYDRWNLGDPDYNVIQFASHLNPAFPKAEYESAKKTMVGWKFRMFYRGEFSRPAGLIYNDFDDVKHVTKPFPIPDNWPRYIGVDFGAVNTAILWVTEHPEAGIYYIYRESHQGGMTTGQHVESVLRYKERIRGAWGGAPGETQQRADWWEAGLRVAPPPVSDVEAGIDRVATLIKQGRLRVFQNLTGLREELRTYSRDVDDRGDPLETIKNKNNFHRLDALRYLAAGMTRAQPVAESRRA